MNEVAQEVLDRVDELGELGAQGFEIIVQQALVEAASKGIWGVIFLAVGVLAWTSARKWSAKREDPEFAFDVTRIASLVPVTIGLINLTSSMKWFLNPEFYAIKWIINSL